MSEERVSGGPWKVIARVLHGGNDKPVEGPVLGTLVGPGHQIKEIDFSSAITAAGMVTPTIEERFAAVEAKLTDLKERS